MVEIIIVLPILLFVMFGIVELSRAWFTAQLTTTAVREAVRVAAVALPTDVSTAGTARLNQVLTAGNMSACPQPPPASCVVASGVTMQPIVGIPGTTDSEVVATATVQFRTLFSNLLPASLQALNITQTAVMRHEGGPPAP